MKRLIAVMLLVLVACPVHAESVYERVKRTKTLRCAYTLYPTFVEKDPNTGAFSGTSYDIIEELGRQLGIKIEWGPEVGSDVAFEGIGRTFDANCGGYSAAPSRLWAGDFTKPFMFIPYNLYIRADEQRFKSFDDLNRPDIKIATYDGELSQIVAKESFPKAEQLTFPAMASTTDRLEAVATGKADAVPMDSPIGEAYITQHPGKLKRFPEPLQVGGSVIVIPHNEPGLKAMLDGAIDAMTWSGALKRILKQHEVYKGTLMPPAQGYQKE